MFSFKVFVNTIKILDLFFSSIFLSKTNLNIKVLKDEISFNFLNKMSIRNDTMKIGEEKFWVIYDLYVSLVLFAIFK